MELAASIRSSLTEVQHIFVDRAISGRISALKRSDRFAYKFSALGPSTIIGFPVLTAA